MFKIKNETDLHCKVVDYICMLYPEAIIIAGLGEIQDTCSKWYLQLEKGLHQRPTWSHDNELS